MSKLLSISSYYDSHKSEFNENFRLKIWRSLSWLKNAEHNEQLDIKFVSLWIAFNAAYADELSDIQGDKNTFINFLRSVCKYNTTNSLQKILNKYHQTKIKQILELPYTFQPFWDFYNGKKTENDWLRMFNAAKKRANTAWNQKETHITLHVIFNHLYTLRNQLIHGGSTFNSKVNREQLEIGCVLLGEIVPEILQIMMENFTEVDWGKPFYPYVKVDVLGN